MRKRMSRICDRDTGGGRMKKHWYDYLWILSLAYLVLGFFNILFAWLGLLCFFIPLIISVTKGTKATATAIAEEASFSAFWAAISDFPAKRIFRNG